MRQLFCMKKSNESRISLFAWMRILQSKKRGSLYEAENFTGKKRVDLSVYL